MQGVLEVPAWMQFAAAIIGALAIIVSGAYVVYGKAIKPVVTGIGEAKEGIIEIKDALPTLLDIAHEFKEERLGNVIRKMGDDIAALKETTVTVSTELKQTTEQVAADLKAETSKVASEQDAFKEYVHDFVHNKFNPQITLLRAGVEANETHLAEVQATLAAQEQRAAEHHPHPHPPLEERRHEETER